MEEQLLQVLVNSGADVSGDRKELPEILNYQQAVRMTLDLAAQLTKMHENHRGFISVTKEQVVMIGDNNFLLKDLDMFRVDSNNKILISRPFEYNQLMAPELKDIDTLPSRVNSNVGYYSICKLVLSLLNIDNKLERLNPTKLFYLMKRIFSPDPEKRRFLYI
jgi:hypothetical protein